MIVLVYYDLIIVKDYFDYVVFFNCKLIVCGKMLEMFMIENIE